MEQSFAEWCKENNPSLLEEWHPVKNQPIIPNQIKPKSNKPIWWLGKCGHEWDAAPYSRLSGNGCPYCCNRRFLKGFNDLKTKNPKLAEEWHPTKNDSLTPSEVKFCSKDKVWWLGKCGHEWKAVVADRSSGRGCPVCRGLLVVPGVNDLATLDPSLASEWHPTKNEKAPTQVALHSNIKVWWLGKCGHEWEAYLNNRSKGVGCPYCSGTKVLPGYNDLLTINPVLASEYHPTKNKKPVNEISSQNDNYVWWLGKCGHEWEDSVYHRASRGDGCPYCSGRRTIPEQTSLQALRPDLAKFWDYVKNDKKPDEVSLGSGFKFHWNCECGHTRYTTISGMINNHCPTCLRELRTSFPEKAIAFYVEQVATIVENYRPDFLKGAELDVYIPELKLAFEYDGRRGHNIKKLPSDIKKNNLCESNGIELIRVREIDCPPIDGNVIPVEKESASDLQIAIESILNKVCRLLNIGNLPIVNLEQDSGKIQEKQYTQFKESSLAVKFPHIAKELHPTKNGNLKSTYLPAYGNRKVWWLGKCGHEWAASPATRSRGAGCPYCAGVLVLKGFNDLQTKNPGLASEWHPSLNTKQPFEYTYGSGQKVWWLGKCGHVWQAAINHRFSGEKCPYCYGTTRVLPGVNDLETINPQLAKEWHPSKNVKLPSEMRSKSNKLVWWLGKCGHEWQATIAHRHERGDGCPFCGNKRVLPGYNDLFTIYPDIANKWHPLKNDGMTPSQVLACSTKKYWWTCGNGHEWHCTIADCMKSKAICLECCISLKQ